jgi:hypothetical protein
MVASKACAAALHIPDASLLARHGGITVVFVAWAITAFVALSHMPLHGARQASASPPLHSAGPGPRLARDTADI